MFGANRSTANAAGKEDISDQSANSGYNNRSSYATRFGTSSGTANFGSNAGVATSHDFKMKSNMLTSSMSDNFGPGSKGTSGPNSFLSPDKIAQNQVTNTATNIEDNDEPELDDATPDERPNKNPIK